MKSLILFTLFAIFIYSDAKAQWYFTQYFDGADTVFENSVNVQIDTSSSNVWQIGIPNKVIFDSASTYPNALVTDTAGFYPANNVSSLQVKVVNNFGSWGIFALQWLQKLDMDSYEDGGLVEFTIDNGTTWQNVVNNPYVYNFYGFDLANLVQLNSGEDAFSGTDSTWKDIWLCFDMSWMYNFPDTLQFRFTFKSDSIDNNKEGWMIDNMIAHITFIHTVKSNPSPENYLHVYPSPTDGIVHVEVEKLMEYHIIEDMELINMYGIVKQRWEHLPTKFWFDASKYDDGIYMLKVKTNIQSATSLVVLNKH